MRSLRSSSTASNWLNILRDRRFPLGGLGVDAVLFLVAHHLQVFRHLVAVGEHPLQVLAVALMLAEQGADHRFCRFNRNSGHSKIPLSYRPAGRSYPHGISHFLAGLALLFSKGRATSAPAASQFGT